MVIDTLPSKDEPTDVVFAGAYAFVSNSRSNTINVFSAITRAFIKKIPVFGGNPRAMAVSADKTKIYAAFALSGNKTTLVPSPWAPDQPTPTNPALPPPPHVGLIVKVDDPQYSRIIRYRMPDNDVVQIGVSTLAVERYFSGVGTINLGIAVRPITGELYVSNTEARNQIRFEPVLKGHIVDNRVTRISVGGTPIVYDLNPGLDYQVLPNPGAISTALAQPAALLFDSLGQRLYVAAFGTDRVAVLNANGQIERRIEIGPSTGTTVNPVTKRGPRGLAINDAAKVLYVSNRVSNTVSVVNLSSFSVVREIPVGTYDPTPLVISKGRGFLYDAKLAGNGTASCAACHVDGENDHLAWDLGDPGGDMQRVTNPDGEAFDLHPMKGPMMTQHLRGLKGMAPYHLERRSGELSGVQPGI